MSVNRSELHELIDALPDDQVASATEALRRRAAPRPAPSAKSFAWIGAGETKDAVTDVSANVDQYLAGFGQDSL